MGLQRLLWTFSDCSSELRSGLDQMIELPLFETERDSHQLKEGIRGSLILKRRLNERALSAFSLRIGHSLRVGNAQLRKQKNQRDRVGFFIDRTSAATYSPTQNIMQYHRRRGA